ARLALIRISCSSLRGQKRGLVPLGWDGRTQMLGYGRRGPRARKIPGSRESGVGVSKVGGKFRTKIGVSSFFMGKNELTPIFPPSTAISSLHAAIHATYHFYSIR